MIAINHQERIFHFFDRIRVLTTELLENFSVKKFTETLRERSNLISSIRHEIDLQRSFENTEPSFEALAADVEHCLNEIRSLDIKVMTIIKKKMDEIRYELKGLSKSAPAVLAYSHHKRLN